MLHVELCQTLTCSLSLAERIYEGEKIRSVVKYYHKPQERDVDLVEGGGVVAAMLNGSINTSQ